MTVLYSANSDNVFGSMLDHKHFILLHADEQHVPCLVPTETAVHCDHQALWVRVQ
jgi:hypothetical protein